MNPYRVPVHMVMECADYIIYGTYGDNLYSFYPRPEDPYLGILLRINPSGEARYGAAEDLAMY